MSQKVVGVKGMNDLFSPAMDVWAHMEGVARELLSRFGYSEIRTPMVEHTELFVRSVGEDTDIVGKEMYTFNDRAERSLSLRPEGTASAIRAYIEHSVHVKEPLTRWFYLGPMFRYERMKTGRYRQFYQLGLEAFGAKDSAQEVEQLDWALQFFNALGLSGVALHINSLGDEQCRPTYQAQLIEFLNAHRGSLCQECQGRLERNPLRVLDCKNPECQKVLSEAPRMLNCLCEDCAEHFSQLQRRLDLLHLPYKVDPGIVRGLDYYNRTVFEFLAADPALGTASAVGGGGRYDSLVKNLGGPDVPGVGLALGLERLTILLSSAGREYRSAPQLFVAAADAQGQEEVLLLASDLRRKGFRVDFDTRGGSLKSQMKRADKSGAKWALVIGEAEAKSRAGVLKPMAGGEPRPAPFDALPNLLKE